MRKEVIMSGLDKISELQHQLDLLRAEVEKQRTAYVIVLKNDEAEKEEKENKSTNKRWRAEENAVYHFTTDTGKVGVSREYLMDVDNIRYDTHNYFKIKEEAEEYANVLEIERQLKKFADEHNGEISWSNNSSAKRYLSYNYSMQSICTRSVWTLKEPRVIYFSSREIAEQAIKTIGEDKIKDYLTYEW